MRTIRKRSAPTALVNWRAPRMLPSRSEGLECNYDELRRNEGVVGAVEDALVAEQGGLCAYTGHQLRVRVDRVGARSPTFHIEHLSAQKYCNAELGTYGKDTEYTNLVACWPRPNCGFEPNYGARRKDSWPAPREESQFVSPLRLDCSSRFIFGRDGSMRPASEGDDAARETISKLNLDRPRDGTDETGTHPLAALRRAKIEGVLRPGGRFLSLPDARKLLQQMQGDAAAVDSGASGTLMEFAFAVEPALRRKIKQLEAIARQR